MTSIKQLIDKDGNPIFPVTHTNAIFDSEGNRIEDRLSNIVNKTKNTKHITENGVKEFSCKDGYVDNVAIEGETLVNLSDRYNVRTDDDDGISRLFFTQQKRCTNGIYTCFNFTDKPIAFNQRTLANETYVSQTLVNANSYEVIQVNADHVIYGVDFQPIFGWSNEDASIYTSSMFAVLEGDHSDKSISYFEGLKSVGQGNKIEVLTREHNKTNLLKSQNVTYKDNYMIVYESGLESASNNHKYTETYIEIEPNTDYCFYHTSRNMCWYDANKNFILQPLNERILGENVNKDLFFSAKSPSNAKYLRVTIIKDIHNNGKTSEIYKGKYDKKQISTTLRSLPNGGKDTIEKRGNKYVKVQRCGEVTLKGSEDWSIAAYFDNVIRFKCTLENLSFKASELQCISDLFKGDMNTQWNLDYEAVDQDATFINIRILRTKLTTQDLEGFKTWLQSNPTTIVYELETPIITELPNFNPQTFEGDTTLLINSGVIQANAEFEVTNSMGSEIEVLKDKVSSLDTSVNKDILNVYSMDLFNGVETTGNKVYGVLQYNDCAILSAELNTTTELRYGQAIGKLHVTPKRASYPILILKINTGTCVQGWLYPDGTIKTLNSIPAGERICFTVPILL